MLEIYMISVWHFSAFMSVEFNGYRFESNSSKNQRRKKTKEKTKNPIQRMNRILGFTAMVNVCVWESEQKTTAIYVWFVYIRFRSSFVPCNQICGTIQKDDIAFRLRARKSNTHFMVLKFVWMLFICVFWLPKRCDVRVWATNRSSFCINGIE